MIDKCIIDKYIAKLYMMDYNYLVKKHKKEIGLIGRFIELFVGSECYLDIEDKLYDKYGLEYWEAYDKLNNNG